jgi:hypothetical protein
VKPPTWRSILSPKMRRTLLALAVSLLLHVGAVGVAIAVGLWQTASLIPRITVQPIAVEVNDLPLGAPLPPQPEAHRLADELPARAARKPKVRVAMAEQGVVVPAVDAGAQEPKRDAGRLAKTNYDGGGSIDGGRRHPGDLRRAGPEGSRLVALFRIDRLRTSADSENTIAAVDRLLLLLPDRRRLIEGSGLDLYRDFDSLLIATPDPTDDAVTFLAARHHLGEAAFKAALDRSAKAAKKSIAWRSVEGRPVGIRQHAGHVGLDRDDRVLVLPAPVLAIIATPAYAGQLFGTEMHAPAKGGTIDGGAPDAGAAQPRPRERPSWPEIVERIEAEDSAIPDEAAFMMTASNLFGKAATELVVVPPTRGQSDDAPLRPVGSNPPPQSVTLLVGVESPFLAISAEFSSAADADRWERDLPTWKRKIVTNPIVILAGFSSLVSRAEISREDNTLQTRIELSTAELQRLLNVIANLTQSMLAGRKP